MHRARFVWEGITQRRRAPEPHAQLLCHEPSAARSMFGLGGIDQARAQATPESRASVEYATGAPAAGALEPLSHTSDRLLS